MRLVLFAFVMGACHIGEAGTVTATIFGVFDDAQAQGPGMAVNGTPGTNTVCFQQFGDNSICVHYAANHVVDQPTGEIFPVGELTVSNGFVMLDGGFIQSANFYLSSDSEDEQFQGPTVVPIMVNILPPTIIEQLEFRSYGSVLFSFDTEFQPGKNFRVSPGDVSTVRVLGRFGSLELIGFGDVISGNGEVVDAEADVPEPSALLLVMLGLVVATCSGNRGSRVWRTCRKRW